MDTDNRQLERDIENAIRARGLKSKCSYGNPSANNRLNHPSGPNSATPSTPYLQ